MAPCMGSHFCARARIQTPTVPQPTRSHAHALGERRATAQLRLLSTSGMSTLRAVRHGGCGRLVA